jgi:hypothetical protein
MSNMSNMSEMHVAHRGGCKSLKDNMWSMLIKHSLTERDGEMVARSARRARISDEMEFYSYMKRLGGKAQRGGRRALIVLGGEATTRQIWEWSHPPEVNCRDRCRRQNISRAIRRAAAQLGLVALAECGRTAGR